MTSSVKSEWAIDVAASDASILANVLSVATDLVNELDYGLPDGEAERAVGPAPWSAVCGGEVGEGTGHGSRCAPAPGGAGMNRRDLLRAAPTALAVSTLPAAASAETPVTALFREWLAHRDWINGPATDGLADEEFDEIAADSMRKVERMLDLPAQDARDLCCKLLAVTEMGTVLNISGLSGTKRLPAEARALIGGAA